MTGLPAAGKTTIATALEQHLVCGRQAAYLLDGDQLRRRLSADLGFSQRHRSEHARRVNQVALLLVDAGVIAICVLIVLCAIDRSEFRL